jgi:hypothetical protein
MCSLRSWEVKKHVNWSSAFIVSCKGYKTTVDPVYIKRESIDQFHLLFSLVCNSSATTQSKIETQHVISLLKCFHIQLNFSKDWPCPYIVVSRFSILTISHVLTDIFFQEFLIIIISPDFDQNYFSNVVVDLYLLKKAFLINMNMLISIS